MSTSTSFTIDKYSATLGHERVNQLLNATTAEQAYRTNQKSLWSRFCDYFCLGSERKTVRALFNAIVDPEKGITPEEHLNRFKNLASYATAENEKKFRALTLLGNRPNTWKYEFRIDDSVIYKSIDRTEAQTHPMRKKFGLDAFVWTVGNDFYTTFSNLTRKMHSEEETQTLSDLKGKLPDDKNQILSDEDGKSGTSQAYLIHHLEDDFFSSANFREIKIIDNNYFDAVFARNGEERVLRLSNRTSTNGEFRGEIAQDAFRENYKNLKELLSMNYGTNQDTLLRYFCTSRFLDLINVLGENIFEDEQVRKTLSTIKLQRPEAEAITMADMLPGKTADK